jgi:membrane protease YdiL (CAAX protease family)
MLWSEGALPVLLSLMTSAVLEEIVFRHGLQGGLQHAGRLRLWGSHTAWVSPANALSTAAFVLAHGLTRSWALAMAVLPASVCLGCLYERRRSLWLCMAAHGGMNALWWLLAPKVDWPAWAQNI